MLRIPILILSVSLLVSSGVCAQEPPIDSRVYAWAQSTVEKTNGGETRRLCRGGGFDLESMEVTATTLAAGQVFAGSGADEQERILVVKARRLVAEAGGQKRILSTRSVALVMPGDECRFAAPEDESATFFVLRYKARTPAVSERGRKTGGSKLIDWADLKFSETDVGGRRQPFERATAMLSESEMHVTTLNPGLTTHAPHTHVPDEIVLMIRGETEMSIAGQPHRATAGDLYFLGSGVPHNIHNVGTEPAEYYAFQWR